MSTKLEVLVLSPSEESKLESSNLTWMFTSLPLIRLPPLNPLKCTTNNSLKPFQETTSDSTLKTSPLKKSKEETSPLIPRETLLEKLNPSWPKSSSLTTLDQFKTDTLQFWIATLPTLPLNSKKSPKRSTEELVNPLKISPKTLNPEMPACAS